MPVRRRATKKVPMAPVEEREVPVVPVKTIPRTPARSELPPAHVCTTDGSQLTFIRELSPGKRLYTCSHGHGPLLFLDEV